MLIILIYSEAFYRDENSGNGHLKFHGHHSTGTAHAFLPPFNVTLNYVILKDYNSLPLTMGCCFFFLTLKKYLDCISNSLFATGNLYDDHTLFSLGWIYARIIISHVCNTQDAFLKKITRGKELWVLDSRYSRNFMYALVRWCLATKPLVFFVI